MVYFSDGKSCFSKYLKILVKGDDSEASSTSDVKSDIKSFRQETVSLLICFFGLQGSYLTWGIIQEKIMTKEYTSSSVAEVGKFSDSQFLVFMNRVLALLISAVYICSTTHPRHSAPLYKYSFASFSNIMSSWCQYEALKYVSFPSQVLAKASKIIPVMAMGKVSAHSFSYTRSILLLCPFVSESD